jgi:hypothetical protein
MTRTSHENEFERVCRSATGLVLATVSTLGLFLGCHTEQASRGGDSTSRAAASIPTAPSVAVAPAEALSGGAGSAPVPSAAPRGPSGEVAPSPTTRVAGGKAAASTEPPGSVSAGSAAIELSASAAAPGSPTASVAPPVIRRRGPVASSDSYETWLETTGAYSPGTAASVVVVLSAKAPFKCNTQYPYKLALDATPGLTYPSPTARGMQVDGKHASMVVPFTPARPGTFTIGGTLSFSTCTADRCLVDKARISVPVDVK